MTDNVSSLPARPTVSRLRRIVVGVIIGSFGLAALGGIVVLLGGDLGSDAGRVLGTTAIVGAFSVAVLCCLSLLGRRARLFGAIGAVVSTLAAALCIVMLWLQPGYSAPGEVLWKLTWSAVEVSAAFALASLLLLLADRRRPAVRVGLVVTLALFAILLIMSILLIWSTSLGSDVYSRAMGIVAILAALGAVVVPVLSLLMPDVPRGAHLAAETSPASLAIAPALAYRIAAEAAKRGVTPEELVAPVLESE